jgi:hypothetical protein
MGKEGAMTILACLLWYCIDDYFAGVLGIPAIGNVPLHVPMTIGLFLDLLSDSFSTSTKEKSGIIVRFVKGRRGEQ